jgi:hypothetical protein
MGYCKLCGRTCGSQVYGPDGSALPYSARYCDGCVQALNESRAMGMQQAQHDAVRLVNDANNAVLTMKSLIKYMWDCAPNAEELFAPVYGREAVLGLIKEIVDEHSAQAVINHVKLHHIVTANGGSPEEPVLGAITYVEKGVLKYRDAAGNITTLGPG